MILLAEEVSGMDAVVSAVVTGVTNATSGAVSAVTGVLPQAMIIFGLGIAIVVGRKIYKTVAK